MWTDIDSANNTISITKTVYKNKGVANLSLNPPKTKESKRILDVDSMVIKLLKRLKARQNAFILGNKDKYKDSGFIFTRRDHLMGHPVPVSTIEKRMKVLLKEAGLNTELSPHSLRHTHTSLLAEAGAELNLIMQRLGHKSDRVTTEIYLHVTKSKKKDAVQKFSALMKNL